MIRLAQPDERDVARSVAERLDAFLARLAANLPGLLGGYLDLARDRLDVAKGSLRAPWGGPFNGQSVRREMVEELFQQYGFRFVIETGTFRGTTTLYLAKVFAVPVVTVEASKRFYVYARSRLKGSTGIRLIPGNSRAVLRRLTEEDGVTDKLTFFYLDAHWNDDLPLWDELEIISTHWKRSVVLIDDFQIPGDEGYGFDDYGPGKKLAVENLPAKVLKTHRAYFPTAPSTAETGARRGATVLVSKALDDPGTRTLANARFRRGSAP